MENTDIETEKVDDSETVTEEVAEQEIVAEDTEASETTTATEDDASEEVASAEDQVEESDEDLMVAAEEPTEDQQEAHDASFSDDEVDWFLLDLALNSLVPEDAKLSAEQREKLPDSAFCGPERSFPVHDCAHYTAALRLISRYKGPGSKDAIRSCVESKGKKLGCVDENADSECKCKEECKCKDCKCDKLADLQKDYAQALKQIDELKQILATTDNKNYSESEISEEISSEALATDDSSDDSMTTAQNDSILSEDNFVPKAVENPALSDTEPARETRRQKELGVFEKNVLAKFVQLKDEYGEMSAMQHVNRLKRQGYLDRNFDPKLLLEE
jgi:hypothetical protein